MKKKSLVITLASIAAIGAIGIGSTFAYFTDSKDATNSFTLGDIEISLTEPSWKEANGVNILPLQTIAKDPTVKNTGDNDAYIFLKITVPTAEVKAEGDDAASVQELFTLNEVSANWTQISHTTGEYVFAYNSVVAPEKSTDALFKSVTLINLVEGDYSAIESLDIDVDAYGVQTVSFDSASAAWAATFGATTAE